MISDSLVFKLPAFFDGKQIQGNIELYRPSDARLDMRDTLNGRGYWSVPRALLSTGKYEMKASWHCEGVDYLLQQVYIVEATN
ncbi:hypothetical protein HGB07_08065 [Candidatus Roizmanbacteria bacterium]|nr:hypothetical protein [Candidatus Roizmanbacteria bacterium]